ncbi:hypothetical protein [Arthrobacter sp.]|uniref:hypothetical protein n=1 Tax=Arthrobacter sp. TaxID=1667 RepID=UPI003A9518FF
MRISPQRFVAAGIVVLLACSLLSSCSRPSAESCDGHRPVPSIEQAVTGLLSAAESGDFDAACAVVTIRQSKQDMAVALAKLNRQAESMGIDPGTVHIRELEQGGSLIPIEISNGRDDRKIGLDVLKVRDEGYRIIWS